MSLRQPPADIPIGGGRRGLLALAGSGAFAIFGVALVVAPNVTTKPTYLASGTPEPYRLS